MTKPAARSRAVGALVFLALALGGVALWRTRSSGEMNGPAAHGDASEGPDGAPTAGAGDNAGARGPATVPAGPTAADGGVAAAAAPPGAVDAAGSAAGGAPAPARATGTTAGVGPPKPSSHLGESQLMTRLRAIKEHDPAAALALAREGNRRFPDTPDAPERSSIMVHALSALERPSEARGEAERMVNHYPDSGWVREVEMFMGAHRHRNVSVNDAGELQYR